MLPTRRDDTLPPPQPGEELRERVVRRAAELAREWRQSEDQHSPLRRERERSQGQNPSRQDTATPVLPRPVDLRLPLSAATRTEEKTPSKPPLSKENIVQRPEPTTVKAEVNGVPPEGLANFFVALGFKVIDKRSLGGNLWVLADDKISHVMKKLGDGGIRFSYKPTGGKATNHQPAWFTTAEG